MASPAVIYFAGISTVVAALGVGFGGALMLTSTAPVQKEPAAGFAKREQPAKLEQAQAPAAPQPAAASPALAAASPAPAAAPPAPVVAATTNEWVAPAVLPIPKAEEVAQALAAAPPPTLVTAAEPPVPPALAAAPAKKDAEISARTRNTEQPATVAAPKKDADVSPRTRNTETTGTVTQERKTEKRKPATDRKKKIMVADKKAPPEAGDEDDDEETPTSSYRVESGPMFRVQQAAPRNDFFGFLFGN